MKSLAEKELAEKELKFTELKDNFDKARQTTNDPKEKSIKGLEEELIGRLKMVREYQKSQEVR